MTRSFLLLAATFVACGVHAQYITGVDPQFGGNVGLVTWNHGGSEQTRPLSLHTRPDGQTLVVGTNYNASGSVHSMFTSLLDAVGRPVPDYGSHGTCTYVSENGHGFMGKQVFGAGLQSDGKAILLCWNPGNSTASVVRLRLDGEVDSTFATNGVIALGSLGAQCVAIQSGDRILVGGADANMDLFIRRYTASGQLDVTYATGGTYIDPLSSRCFRLHELADGRWLVVGRSPGAVILLSADGIPDASYGSNGHATDPLATGFLGPNDAAFQPDGKILLSTDTKIRRLLADGITLDPVFPFNNNNVTGSPQLFAASDGSWYYYSSSSSVLIKRTAADLVDDTFGANGVVNPVFDATTFLIEEGQSVSLLATVPQGNQEGENGCLERYTAAGQPDLAWGADGRSYVAGTDAAVLVGHSVFDASGRIVVLGRPWSADGCLARFNTDGTIDETFSYDGLVSLAQSNVAVSVTSQSSDQLVVAGFTTQGNGANGHVERLEENGNDDPTYFQWLPFSPGLNQQRPTDAVTMPDDQVAVLANISDINSGGIQTTGVAMITTGGAVNTAFGNNGVFQQVQQGYQNAGSITLDPDGNIMCAVAENDDQDVMGITFYKLDPLGVLVASFGTNGFKHVDLPTAPYGVTIRSKPLFLPDGRFHLTFDVHSNDFYGAQLARFLPSGDLDPGFSGGLVETLSSGVLGMPCLLSDGSIICPSASQSMGEAYIQKFLPTGEVDLAFGTDGTLTITDPDRFSFAAAHALVDADDQVYISGILSYTSGWNTGKFDSYLFHLAPDFNTSTSASADAGTAEELFVYPSLVTDEFTVRGIAPLSPSTEVRAFDATGRMAPLELVRSTADGAVYRMMRRPAPGMYTVVQTDRGHRVAARIMIAGR